MVFADFLLSREFLLQVAPGFPPLLARKFLHRDKFVASVQLCTATLHQVALG
jgi:hypothetical protein